MGIARGAIGLLLEEAKRRPFSGRLATLGRQTIYATWEDVAEQFAIRHVVPCGEIPRKGTDGLDDMALFGLMGFGTVESLDYSDFEGATHVIDLNSPGLPADLAGQFDSVLDSGTLEHVFHIPNALANILSLAKIGGRVIFLAPSSNHVDHGFYMFSPTFFYDYLLANGLRLETIYMVRYAANPSILWDVYEYDPGTWSQVCIGGLDARPYAVFVVATRTEGSTTDVIPQQGFYARERAAYAGSRLAGDGAVPSAADPPKAEPRLAATASHARLRAVLTRVPGALALARRIRGLFRRRFKSVGRF